MSNQEFYKLKIKEFGEMRDNIYEDEKLKNALNSTDIQKIVEILSVYDSEILVSLHGINNQFTQDYVDQAGTGNMDGISIVDISLCGIFLSQYKLIQNTKKEAHNSEDTTIWNLIIKIEIGWFQIIPIITKIFNRIIVMIANHAATMKSAHNHIDDGKTAYYT